MKNQKELQQIVDIFKLLFEIATGTRTTQARKLENQSELEKIYNELIDFDEKLQVFMKANNLYVPSVAHENLTQLIFVLNKQQEVVNFNQEVLLLLHYNSEELINIQFEQLIALEFREVWRQIVKKRKPQLWTPNYAKLTFITTEGKLFPTYCSITNMAPNYEIIVTSIITEKESTAKLHEQWFELTNKDIIQKNFSIKLYDYIMERLNQQLPSLQTIARELGTEEHLLKTGFKKYYKTSVYQLYQDERLKRAEVLIQQTAIPLKEIAYLCGFKSYLNFYKSFKKKYKYAPSDLLRKT
ncbi:helix-turn-helix domain-containing protein [Flavobacterium sp. SM2513]|uniref:helix-turn-helix domain-containing protein n=1 Tax=Flavobacterium sp. SM2513 TaxID=3424766 RepID=UPI003D7F2C9C